MPFIDALALNNNGHFQSTEYMKPLVASPLLHVYGLSTPKSCKKGIICTQVFRSLI